jgi:urease beta subunit
VESCGFNPPNDRPGNEDRAGCAVQEGAWPKFSTATAKKTQAHAIALGSHYSYEKTPNTGVTRQHHTVLRLMIGTAGRVRLVPCRRMQVSQVRSDL